MNEPVSHPASPGRPRDPDLDRRILDAARAILVADGYAAITVAAVARQSGLPRSTVYRRYPSVIALRYAVAVLPVEGAAPLAETGDLHADMRSHIATNAAAFRDPAQNALLRALMADVLVDADARAAVNAAFVRPRLAQIGELFERARARGDLPPHVVPDLAAKAITGTLIYHAILLDEPVDQAMVDALVAMLFRPSP